MFARSLTAIALAATVIGCAPSMRGHREYYGTSWDDWRGILGNSVVLASGDGTAIHGEVTQVTFFRVTQVRIRTDERDRDGRHRIRDGVPHGVDRGAAKRRRPRCGSVEMNDTSRPRHGRVLP